MKVYYNQDNIIVRDSTKADVEYLSEHLRESDIQEIFASHHSNPKDALTEGLKNSIFCLTVQNGNPIMMFGINPESVLGTKATIWMLASDDLFKIKTRFLRNSRKFVDMMLEWYPYLHNYVDVRNRKTIAWLKFLGAKINSAEPYGVEQLPFHHFYFSKGE